MAEILFYHLVAEPLEKVLPVLLEKSLERGWRAVVQTDNDERVAALNTHLWTYRDESFLPHGSKLDGSGNEQPVWLTSETDNPNEADIRFLVDGTHIEDATGYQRVIYMFDGNDQEQLSRARARWKVEKEAGHDVTYWAQNERGRWEKKA